MTTIPLFQNLLTIGAIADLSILENQTIALFCSIQCPGNLVLKSYDLAAARRINYKPLLSNFHFSMGCLYLPTQPTADY